MGKGQRRVIQKETDRKQEPRLRKGEGVCSDVQEIEVHEAPGSYLCSARGQPEAPHLASWPSVTDDTWGRTLPLGPVSQTPRAEGPCSPPRTLAAPMSDTRSDVRFRRLCIYPHVGLLDCFDRWPPTLLGWFRTSRRLGVSGVVLHSDSLFRQTPKDSDACHVTCARSGTRCSARGLIRACPCVPRPSTSIDIWRMFADRSCC